MINRNSTIVILVLISILAFSVTAYTSYAKPVKTTADTKLAFTNNGLTWVHIDAVIENMQMKDGSTKNVYVDAYIKPGGNVNMDLSKLAGYGNQPLPAGTTIRLLAWDGLYNPTVSTTLNNLNLNIQGWSKTTTPQSTDKIYNTAYSNLKVSKLPNGITNSIIKVTTNPNNFRAHLASTSLQTILDEKILTIDSKGKLTMVTVTPPVLCKIMAHPNSKKWIKQQKLRFIQEWNYLTKYHIIQKHL